MDIDIDLNVANSNININSNDNNNRNDDDSAFINIGGVRRSKRIKSRKRTSSNMGFNLPNNKRVKRIQKPKIIKSATQGLPLKKQSLLSLHNEKYTKLKNELNNKRIKWIKHYWDNFKTFASKKIKKRIYNNNSNNNNDITFPDDLKQQPKSLLFGELRDYQLSSINWMKNLRYHGCNGILADEMGLGKTIQSISNLVQLYEESGIKGPHLIVVPLSVAEAWLDEFDKWTGNLFKCVLLHGPTKQCKGLMNDKLKFGNFDVCITTYEMVIKYNTFLTKFYWNYLIIDEAHRIKCETTIIHNKMTLIRNLYCILLTGTPIQNNTHELWGLLSFIYPVLFEESDIFDRCYKHTTMEEDKNILSKIPKLLQPFYVRRMKSDVELTLPPKEEIILKIPMSNEQTQWYKLYLAAHANLIDKVSDIQSNIVDTNKTTIKEWKKIRHLYMQLRKISLHPYLLPTLEAKILPNNEFINASGKLIILDKLINRLISNGHRILIFSCFTSVLDILEVYLKYKLIKYLRLDGSTTRIKRKIDISRFNDPNSIFNIYLISNRAGGLGINLQTADTVVHFDTDWNPQADLQAQARAHRIGQKKTVKIYRLICKDTVEERILFRSLQKLYLNAIINEGTKMLKNGDIDEFDLKNDDLLGAIKFGAQTLFEKNDLNDVNEFDLDRILSRSITNKSNNDNNNNNNNESKQDNEILKELTKNNVRDFNFKMELVAGNVFKGVKYDKKKQKNFSIVLDDINSCGNIKRIQRKRINNKNASECIKVDGMSFTIKKTINPLNTFYEQCSEFIWDNKISKKFKHQINKCWGCDNDITKNDINKNKIIKCSQCPKVFHNNNKCWRGNYNGISNQAVCSQHSCMKCYKKTSECGLILRCLGCPSSFCIDCAPKPKWKGGELYYIDNCNIDEYYQYNLPKNVFMYIFCCDICKNYYEKNYSLRILPKFNYDSNNLPNDLLYEIKRNNNKYITFNDIKIIDIDRDNDINNEYYFNKKITISESLKKFNGNCQLIIELYKILYNKENNNEFNKQHLSIIKHNNNNDLTLNDMNKIRHYGISLWSGFNDNNIKNILKFYDDIQYYFNEWRRESLKTLMDHLGFNVITKKIKKNGEYRKEKISSSYKKDKIINALSKFITKVNPKFLNLTTQYFAK